MFKNGGYYQYLIDKVLTLDIRALCFSALCFSALFPKKYACVVLRSYGSELLLNKTPMRVGKSIMHMHYRAVVKVNAKCVAVITLVIIDEFKIIISLFRKEVTEGAVAL